MWLKHESKVTDDLKEDTNFYEGKERSEHSESAWEQRTVLYKSNQ